MYGLMERVYLSMIGKSHSHIKCLFKSSSDGGEFGTLVERVAGVSGLLFVIQDDKQHTIACHIDGPLISPVGPTSALTIGCPVTFYSISGPFEEGGIAKITPPHYWQRVDVAGVGGGVLGSKGLGGKVCIGGGRLWLGYGERMHGRLWLGYGDDGRPAGDLRSCLQWVWRDELPDDKSYVGSISEQRRTTLAAGIAKIDVPHGEQCVQVAGAEGVVKDRNGATPGKVAIGGGRLWPGMGKGRPAGDLHRCCQFVEGSELPDDKTYVGDIEAEGVATLAARHWFTAQRLEVYQVWSTLPADPILPADDLQALIDMTRGVGMTAQLLHKVVDYVRRIRLASDAATPLPTSSSPDELLYACDMYGLMERVYLSTIGKSHSHIKCLFKSSSDGGEFGTLVERVAGVSGLLFVIQDDKQHTIACHIDGPLIPPADPTSALGSGCPVTFYSVSGPFEEGGIARITVPHHWQWVEVAGTEGTLNADNGVTAGKVCIGGGRLWLGYGRRGRPAGDLRLCHQWLWRDELPDDKTYVGTFDEEGCATLASSDYFTAQRLEVYQVWSTLPADPILPADDLQALIDTTRHIGMTAQLLYKGERDGWAHETMLAKVGEAADLLLVAKDTGSHTFACHIEGQLKQPADPTGVAAVRCAVTFCSISGAFIEGGITKITVPHDEQHVQVAGTEGAVMASNTGVAGKVAIAAGRLWLGYGEDERPPGDLRSCHQWVWRDELPDDKTHVGKVSEQGRATLAASLFFTCVDLEIYTLQVPDGWQWLSAVADIMLSQST
ncbi:unnamed protein product [Vitrella brassicaformis CCMP3155]|uniref:Uncharacterized protein n=1 Tax=Vitrella brassicaformis (strain CCMP3155) TaxID=1169540 RepID=A0A0G4EVY8_VITBC|nr:unnamed protein product [Vitrella brassicaformis CCMP3155]|eukprot:CEM02262.1 unnamed protein product [Vitrella brassicaformis CCMP3155]